MIPSPAKDTYDFKVLIVDDDPTILNLVKEVVSLVPGCTVTTAMDPKEAMKVVIQGGVDIVFTDVHMPGVTGIEMIKDIIALEQTPEVIIMTAFPSGEIAQAAMELGATSLIAKPFEDISLVEAELEKAVKRLLRQRSAKPAAAEEKAELSSKAPVAVDNDAPMALSLDNSEGGATLKELPEIKVPELGQPPVRGQKPKNPLERQKVYEGSLLTPLTEIEIPRCVRNSRQFAIGIIDLPENLALTQSEELARWKEEQILRIETCVRRSDVMLDLGRDGMGVIAYECNKLGSEVVEHKFKAAGFPHTGFAVFPSDGKTAAALLESAKEKLQNKRKYQILLLEKEEFFGRIVQNMLVDPKYNIQWVRTYEEAYSVVTRDTEVLRLMILSLSKDPEQWKLLAKFRKENLNQWPILLFIDIPISKELKTKLKHLGVNAVVSKTASQEEFLYIVQSFVLPKPQHEERKNFRALVTLPIVYKWGDKEISTNTFTLSKDGLFIRELNPPPAGTYIDLKIYVSGRLDPLITRGEVLYAIPYFVGVNRIHVAGMAVRFVDLTDDERDFIDKYVSTCLTSYLI